MDFFENMFEIEWEYKKTGNPLLVWDAILECRKQEYGLPDWVLNYLESVAEEIVSLRPKKGEPAKAIRDALEFKDIDKPFFHYRMFLSRGAKQELTFFLNVCDMIEGELANGAGKEEAYRTVGERCFKDGNPEGKWIRARDIYLEMKRREKWWEENRAFL